MKTNLSLSTSDLNLTALRLVSKLIASYFSQRKTIRVSDWPTNKLLEYSWKPFLVEN